MYELAGLHSADYQPTVDKVTIECPPSIYRDVDRVLIEMSIVGIVEGIYRHSTADAFSAHDPRGSVTVL